MQRAATALVKGPLCSLILEYYTYYGSWRLYWRFFFAPGGRKILQDILFSNFNAENYIQYQKHLRKSFTFPRLVYFLFLKASFQMASSERKLIQKVVNFKSCKLVTFFILLKDDLVCLACK